MALQSNLSDNFLLTIKTQNKKHNNSLKQSKSQEKNIII